MLLPDKSNEPVMKITDALAPILVAEGLRRTYRGNEAPVEAVRGVTLEVKRGEFVAIMGPSGCGKSTLLHLCGAMDRPTGGRILLEGRVLNDLDDEALTRLRRLRIGFVFQFFNLLPTLTLIENVSLPLLLAGTSERDANPRALELLARVELGDRQSHFPHQLSGGEMQRAAIARALLHKPALVIADEPTGNLDSDNGARVLQLISELHRENGVTILLATHSLEIAKIADRTVYMRDGQVERIEELSLASL